MNFHFNHSVLIHTETTYPHVNNFMILVIICTIRLQGIKHIANLVSPRVAQHYIYRTDSVGNVDTVHVGRTNSTSDWADRVCSFPTDQTVMV